MDPQPLQAIAVSLGLGLLVGLQREWKETNTAGIRTFPLFSLLGTVCALVSTEGPQGLVAVGLLAVTVLLVVANLPTLRRADAELGVTTEAAALVMFAVGAALGLGVVAPAIVVGGVTAVLLHWKKRLHAMVDRIGEKDLRALFNLVLIALVILPLLPDQTYGPYDVLNPYKIWLMVVLIVGISLAAYVAYQFVGARAGAVLGGVLGGLISSTATTVSYARQTRGAADLSPLAALVIMIASTVVKVRVLFEIGVVAPQLLKTALLPLGALLLFMAAECAVLAFWIRRDNAELPEHDNPAQLKPAIVFGALYAVVLLVVAAAKYHLGDRALYGVAAISGLTDVDAITLSTAELFEDGRVAAGTAWRVILIATMSNLVFKGGAAAVLGSRRLAAYLAVLFSVTFVASGLLLAFWPDIDPAWLDGVFSGAEADAEPVAEAAPPAGAGD